MRNFYAATTLQSQPIRKEGSTLQQALNALSQELSRQLLQNPKQAKQIMRAWKDRVSGPTAI
jgi:hypothetical protein